MAASHDSYNIIKISCDTFSKQSGIAQHDTERERQPAMKKIMGANKHTVSISLRQQR